MSPTRTNTRQKSLSSIRLMKSMRRRTPLLLMYSSTYLQILKCLNNKANALIQSPTGTGKTLSLLCSTLSWAYEYQTKRNEPPPQIIYASRTHAQLKQVVSQINKLCFQVKIAILSSRDQSCANEDLKLLRGQDKELECRLRVAQRKGLNCNLYQVLYF